MRAERIAQLVPTGCGHVMRHYDESVRDYVDTTVVLAQSADAELTLIDDERGHETVLAERSRGVK